MRAPETAAYTVFYSRTAVGVSAAQDDERLRPLMVVTDFTGSKSLLSPSAKSVCK